jgi:hypothetical protein
VSSVRWIKSSRSGAYGGDCVEVAILPERIAIRDSKAVDSGVLTLAPSQWRAFLAGVRHGALDLP